MFKFGFGNRQDMKEIFRNHLWSLNGSERTREQSIQQITFETTTFHAQVHGLSLVFLHSETAKQIGGNIGKFHLNTINRRSVVANRYLRFRVDLYVDNPLPACYFLERNDGNDVWVQFKFERLSDFCYVCGKLDHITVRCTFKESTTVITLNGISARVYGPWNRAEHKGSMNFINTLELSRQQQIEVEAVFESGDLAQITEK